MSNQDVTRENYEGKIINEQRIETPDLTIAEYSYTDHVGNPVYYDGAAYWIVDRQNGNRIEYYN